jgi:hypothetical protein
MTSFTKKPRSLAGCMAMLCTCVAAETVFGTVGATCPQTAWVHGFSKAVLEKIMHPFSRDMFTPQPPAQIIATSST